MLTSKRTTPQTSATLLLAIRECGVIAEGEELAFTTDPPPELLPMLAVLHTGIRALMTRRQWWGCESDRPRVEVLSTDFPIPVGITLLSVEGDSRWDRIDPAARLELPRLFVAGK